MTSRSNGQIRKWSLYHPGRSQGICGQADSGAGRKHWWPIGWSVAVAAIYALSMLNAFAAATETPKSRGIHLLYAENKPDCGAVATYLQRIDHRYPRGTNREWSLLEVNGGAGAGVFNASGTNWNVFIQGGSGNNIMIGGTAHDLMRKLCGGEERSAKRAVRSQVGHHPGGGSLWKR